MQPPEAPPLWQYDPYAGRRRKQWLKKALVGTLLVAGASMPFMPATIRIHLPGGMKLHIPRVEFVHDSVPGAPVTEPTEASLVGGYEPEVHVDAISREAEPDRRRPRHAQPPAARHRAYPTLHADEEPDNVTYVPDNPVTVVPVKVKTEIRLASRADRGAVGAPDVAAAGHDTDPDSDDPAASRDDWPFLCGQVVDAAGTPVIGARVELESPPVSVYTENDGRFCVVCPRGERTIRVDGFGRGRATRIVYVRGNNFENRIALSRAR